MAFELRTMSFQRADALKTAGSVSFFAGTSTDAAQSTLWISGQIESDMPNMKSLALHQLKALGKVRDLIDGEIARLTRLYEQAERSQS
jgi:hypothetical protein